MANQPYNLLLGESLVRKGLISEAELNTALAEQKKTRELLGQVLVRLGYLSDEKLFQVLAEQSGHAYVKIKGRSIPTSVISEVPVRLVSHYHAMPLESTPTEITMAFSQPISIHYLDDLRLLLKKEIKVVLARDEDVTEAIKKYYGIGADTLEQIPESAAQFANLSIQAQETQEIDSKGEEASIIKFVNQILYEAYKERSTDIHIEPFEDEISIRYRIDGILYETKVPPSLKKFQYAIISRIKIMSNLNIAESRLPQDGRIKIRVGEVELDLRVSILPTPYGESIGIRLLSSDVHYSLESLGLAAKDRKTLEGLIQKPHGIIFVTGPTGSGKSTTLYASLEKINTKDRKIITVEDPIEYQLKGVTQIQVHPKINLTFAQALRAMLRHDPDVMMVGEVRDFETAEITIRAALTGHLVLSTIHTNSAAGGITRLTDMGIEPYLIASSVESFIAQRLVRLICQHCKTQAAVDLDTLRSLDGSLTDAQKVTIYEGKGCDSCKHTGYRGRTAIYEVLPMSEPIRELILRKASAEEIRKRAMKLGMRTLRQDGWDKVLTGITTVSEVLRVTQEEEAALVS